MPCLRGVGATQCLTLATDAEFLCKGKSCCLWASLQDCGTIATAAGQPFVKPRCECGHHGAKMHGISVTFPSFHGLSLSIIISATPCSSVAVSRIQPETRTKRQEQFRILLRLFSNFVSLRLSALKYRLSVQTP